MDPFTTLLLQQQQQQQQAAASVASLKPAAAVRRHSTATALTEGTTTTDDDDEDEDDYSEGGSLPYWQQEEWIPMTNSGKQRTPNMIRNELQRYIDTNNTTQSSVIQQLGVNNNSFRKFMNPKTYKDPWSAVQNGTYWAAARFLEAKRNKPKKQAATGAKRKAAPSSNTNSTNDGATSKKSKKEAAQTLMDRINAFEAPQVSVTKIYDSCPELVQKIKAFLADGSVTKAAFLRTALGNLNSNSLARFLAGKQQDQQANVTYGRAWVFFEKKRLLEGAPKSKQRLRNEAEQHPHGFSTERPRTHEWVFGGTAGARF